MNDQSTGSKDLDARLAALPRALPPARDLWPAIDAAITAHPATPRRWPYALAAGVALAAFGALLGARLVHAPAPATQASRSGPAEPSVVPARLKGSQDAEYRATRVALESTYRERIALLEPQTRARIEQDLALIRTAHEDIRQALDRDPGSRVLMQLLQSTAEQEFSLYSTVGRNTEPLTPRTRT